jgi:hypothetical protein
MRNKQNIREINARFAFSLFRETAINRFVKNSKKYDIRSTKAENKNKKISYLGLICNPYPKRMDDLQF